MRRASLLRRMICALLPPVGVFTAAPAWADDAPDAGFGVRYTTEIIADVAGGTSRGAGWLGRLDLHWDSGDHLFGIDGAEAYANLFLLHGPRFSTRYAGDVQTVSNIDAPSAIRPFEAWVQLPIATDIRAKAGLIDLNSEFDQQSVGDPFLNSSFGIGPDISQSGLNGPSIFPVTSPALVIAAEHGGTHLRLGIFDAEPGFPDHPGRFEPGPLGRDGALLIAEAGWSLGDGAHMQIGAWRYTDRFDRLDGQGRASSGGVYGLVQGRLAGSEKGRALRAWLRAGVATAKADPIDLYVGGGGTYGDDDSLVGLAVARAELGGPGRRAGVGTHDAETTIEATAFRRVARFMSVQPDVQYVIHPSWQPGVGNAMVLALRFHFSIGAD
jgi:porin